MSDAPSFEKQLSLYSDVTSTASGRYFCDERMFALPTAGNAVERLDSGQQVFESIAAAMRAAKKFIWIADWQMAFDVELEKRGAPKPNEPPHPGRLIKVIESLISTKPVEVRILLFGSPVQSLPPHTEDVMVAKTINAINKKGWPGKVIVQCQSSTSAQIDAWEYSHHQKFVVVDGAVGFLGGLDLSYGRFDTAEFDVVIDPSTRLLNESYNPCADHKRGLSNGEKELVKQGFATPYTKFMLEEGCQARMPWQDVHIKITGPAVVDIHRNFVRRWNMQVRCSKGKETIQKTIVYGPVGKAFVRNSTAQDESADSPAEIDLAWLTTHGALEALQTLAPKSSGAVVQIVRSVSSDHLRDESYRVNSFAAPDDIELFPNARERLVFKQALQAWKGEHQNNILNAMVNCIRSADAYIYIETQFFISDFGTAGQQRTRTGMGRQGEVSSTIEYSVDSKQIGNEHKGIQNTILLELGNRILHHIKAKTDFHVYLVIPVHPEGAISDGSTWKQHWLALASIHHGSKSLVGRIKEFLLAQKRSPDEWNKYLTVLNMRNHGVAVQYARDPRTFDEDFRNEIGRYLITEQVYIHSKLMIVDDAVAIVGTANINDRSLTGNGDTEIAAVVVDTDGVEKEKYLGAPGLPVVTRKFARELRRQLWAKHFGFLLNPGNYFSSEKRAVNAQAEVPAPVPHPPRAQTTGMSFRGATSVSWKDVLDRPCAPSTVTAIQSIAARNRDAYEAVFAHTPRNGMKGFQDILANYTVPYSVKADLDARLLEQRENDRYELKRQRVMLSGSQDAGYTQSAMKKLEEEHRQELDDMQVKAWSEDTLGVVPPALQPGFMTSNLLPHQQKAAHTSIANFQKRYVTYEGNRVHDVNTASEYLRSTLVGFFVLAPLKWGDGVPVNNSVGADQTISITRADTPAVGTFGRIG